jgi:excisionase family DNA binding protein
MKQLRTVGTKPECYSISDLAEITNESDAVWRKRIFRREIAYLKLGRNVRVHRQELDSFLSTRQVEGRR